MKKISFILLAFVTFVSQMRTSDSANILALFTSTSKSHLIIHMSIASALIERGHNLTIVTTLELNDPNAKYHHIKLPAADHRHMITKMAKMEYWEKMTFFISTFPLIMQNSVNSIKHPKFQNILKEEKSFDLVLLGYFFNEFELGVAAHFKCPSVISWMLQPVYFINTIVGNPDETNYVMSPWVGSSSKLTFFGRVKNYLFAAVDRLLGIYLEGLYKTYYRELFPSNKYPSLVEVRKNVSLILSNHHFSQGPIKASVPALIEVGGIAIEENPKPLPKDVQDHLDNTQNGAIFFSMGSNAHSSDLGVNTTAAIFKVLSKLNQNVIWKWEDENIPGNSKNILYKKWVSQNGVLAHPNTKLFITHGGKGSVLESQYHGVPMIGLPLFGDQQPNVNTFVEQGYGLGLDSLKLTEEELESAIKEIFTNKKYEENIKQFKKVFRDRPMSPKETAVYWIEYVIRHNGAKYMQSQAVYMNSYELYGLDVLGSLGAVIYLVYRIFKFIVKFLWRKCCSCFGQKNEVKNREKTKPKKQFKSKKE